MTKHRSSRVVRIGSSDTTRAFYLGDADSGEFEFADLELPEDDGTVVADVMTGDVFSVAESLPSAGSRLAWSNSGCTG